MMFFLYRYFLKVTLVTATILLAETGLNFVINPSRNIHLLQSNLTAQAQEYDEEQLESYAQAILAMEPLRENTYQEIQMILNSQNIPSIACNRRETYEKLPSEARSLIIKYCNRSKEIVQERGLTVSEFNRITAQIQSNPELKRQIQQEMLQLQ